MFYPLGKILKRPRGGGGGLGEFGSYPSLYVRALTHQKTPCRKHALFTLSSSLNLPFPNASTKYTIIFPILPGSKLNDSQSRTANELLTIYPTNGPGKCVSTKRLTTTIWKLIFAFRCWPAFKTNQSFSWQRLRASKKPKSGHIGGTSRRSIFFAFCSTSFKVMNTMFIFNRFRVRKMAVFI